MTFYSKYHSLPIPKGSNRTRRKALLAVCMLLCIFNWGVRADFQMKF